jgi:uncharacterized protein
VARRYLLSIDGGGIRGILPVCALIKLERTTGYLTREIFSFVAGTSTGALIAAAIAAGVPAEQILNLYVTRSREIFPQSWLRKLRRVLFGSMYSTTTLRRVLREEIGPATDWTLNDAPVDLLLTAKRLSDGKPWYFVRDQPGHNSCRTGRLSLIDCAIASAAAPTYFQPWTLAHDPARQPDEQPIGQLVDGSVGVAGNPIYQACVEAFFYSSGYAPDDTTIVSLGTGRFAVEKRPIWLGAWLEWLLGELLRSPGEQQTEIVRRHFERTIVYRLDPDLKRLDPTLERGIGLDEIACIDRLQTLGERFAAQIPWLDILAGVDPTFRIGERNTEWFEYSRAAQPGRTPDTPALDVSG